MITTWVVGVGAGGWMGWVNYQYEIYFSDTDRLS